jgi:arylsulfatase A-like enzyme
MVPLVIAGPGVSQGQVRTELVSAIDLAPTVAELSGNTTFEADGRSLVPLLHGESPSWRKFAVLTHWYAGKVGVRQTPLDSWDMWDYGAIVTSSEYAVPNRLYVEYLTTNNVVPWTGGTVAGREYYLLDSDPNELSSQHANPVYEDEVTALSTTLEAFRTCAGPTCRQLEEQ